MSASIDPTIVRIIASRCYFCGASEGEPCRSVGGRVIVWPHQQRIKLAGVPSGRDGLSEDARDDAIDLYRDTVIELVFGYRTPEIVALAMKDRSIDERKQWVKKALAGKPIHCAHARVEEMTEERYDPLFGDVPTETITHRTCKDCGERVA